MSKLNRPPKKDNKTIKEATKDIERAAKVFRLVKNENKNSPDPKKALTKREQEKQERVDKELAEEIEWRDREVARIFKEGRKRGRPTKITEQVIRDAEVLARIGLSERAIAESLMVSHETFTNWLKKNKEFFNRLKVARNTGKSKLVNSIYGHGQKNWQALAWLLERQYRSEFALDKQKLEISGKAGESLTFNVTYKESPKNVKAK